ncbi:MAG: glycosyltransferase family 2 protein [Actinobacteria bacterium]|nr:glycosyltransferase family 2 protein [Actinomycetota bacterium]
MPDVILPVLDEAEAITWVLERMPAGWHPIVVDNGSSDGSGDIARRLGAEVVFERQRGFGAACLRGLQTATSEIVCFMDCDGSLDPCDLAKVAAPVVAGEAELVLGRRRASAGAWPLHARFANFALCAELARRTGVRLRDLGPMRAAPRAGLVDLALADRRSGWPLEMVLRAHTAGWRLAEVPVAYLPRSGRSKVTGTVRGTLQAVHDMAGVLR